MAVWNVINSENGVKLIAFLKQKLGDGYSAKELKRAIESNLCDVNGRVERFASYVLGTGDRVTINLDLKPAAVKGKANAFNANAFIESNILYQDSDLLILNKPKGVVSDGIEFLKCVKSFDKTLELAHRLDRDTTGVLLFAKGKENLELLFDIFRLQKIRKSYLAIVDGIPSKKNGVIENHLGKIHQFQGQTLWGAVDEKKGLYACTEWHCEKHGKQASLIRCFPKTGRTHQIRVHLNGIGHPILGDYQYGRTFRCPYRPGRYLLHASAVSFEHPRTHKEIGVEAPLPDDFGQALVDLNLKGT